MRRISFPIFDIHRPLRDQGAQGKVLIGLKMTPIVPVAGKVRTPSYCEIIGQDEAGRHWQITRPIAEWDHAIKHRRMHFIEYDGLLGPAGELPREEKVS